jgi:nucleoside-diphosphate-sugar epimerase
VNVETHLLHMLNKGKKITIFGGDGFIGSQVVKLLSYYDVRINIINSYRLTHDNSCIYSFPGYISNIKLENSDEFFNKVMGDSDFVINAIDDLNKNTYNIISKKIAYFSKAHNICKLIHISAFGVDENHIISKDLISKLQVEKDVLSEYPYATIIRPNVVFGTRDKFFNNLIKLAEISCIFPLINNGNTLLQPIYVKDLAKLVLHVMSSHTDCYTGKILEAGGPNKIKFKEIIDMIYSDLGKKYHVLQLNYHVAKTLASIFSCYNKFPITAEEVMLSRYNHIISNENAAELSNEYLMPIKQYLKNII